MPRPARRNGATIPRSGSNPDRQHQTCRGVSYYADAAAARRPALRERVYLPTSDARLIALDAANGQVCASFADQGTLNLETGMPYSEPGYYYSTSPPLIAGGKIIVGGAVNDNYSTQEPSGVIRAFDVDTGALVWNWDSGNPDETTPLPAGQTYTANSPNSWSTRAPTRSSAWSTCRSATRRRTSSASGRSANVEKYSSSIVALDLATGQMRWVRQTVHHDLWDMDVPAQPALVDITTADGRRAGAGRADQAGRHLCARPAHRRADHPVKEVPAPRRRDRGRPHGADAAGFRSHLQAAAADRRGHVGRHHVRPAGLPHRLSQRCATRAATRRRRCRAR